MDEIIKVLLIFVGTVTPTGIVIAAILFYPEKVETWASIFWKILASLGGLFKFAHKKYVVHDLQGRVNSFVKKIKHETSSLGEEKLKIEFVDENINRGAFIDNNQVVIRLKRNDPEDHNFVHASYFFVSKSLLSKCKRYLSPVQKEAIDLFTCSKLIKDQKPSVTGFFLDNYLNPKTEDTKSTLALYLDDLKQIDDGNLYFPILLQELKYLGNKVFGRKRDEIIITEVKKMFETLKNIANRDVGDEHTDLEYYGEYCKFAIMIVGKIEKISEGTSAYERYITKTLIPKGAESVYLICRMYNKEKLIQLSNKFSSIFNIDNQRQLSQNIRRNGNRINIDSYLIVLRKSGIDLIQSSK